MAVLLFLLLGLFVGIFGTLVGIGGGLICVPVFIFFMSDGGIYPYFHTAAQITGTSLFVVLANAVSGTLAYIRQKRVFFRAAVPFALATLPGAFFGSYIVNSFSAPQLDLYYGLFMLCMACIMFWNTTHKPPTDIHEIPEGFQFSQGIGILSSFGVGFVSSIFGIGGGVIHVPLMIYLLNKAPQGGTLYGYASAVAYVITIMIVIISVFLNTVMADKDPMGEGKKKGRRNRA